MSEFTSPLVSVIVPNFNYKRYLIPRINSILNQSMQDFEIILLDDASTDGSAQLIEAYRSHPKVSVVEINSANSGGPFTQWAKGLGLARGKYVWIAEADDLAHPDFLKHSVAALEQWPSAGFAMSMSHLIDSQGNSSPHKSFDKCKPDGNALLYHGRSFLAERIRTMNPCYNASQALIRRDTWLQTPRKDFTSMRYCGDWLFWIEMLITADVAEIHLPLNSWRIHGSSTTDRSKINVRGVEENLMVLHRLMELPAGILPTDTRRVLLYRYCRNFLRDSSMLIPEDSTRLKTAYLAPLALSASRFRLLSLYKHLASPIIHKLSPLRPLASMRLQDI